MAYKYLNDEGLKALVKKIKSYVSGLLPTQKVTWAELKALRDGGKLTAGRKYRITDFVTTSAQAETRSAGHAFDVIVTADDEKTLNENAHAAIHSGDTYFSDCKLNAWELKYSLDNDAERFAWADVENGKGVIWWMRDEWDNECFYDFKNIQFKRYKMEADNAIETDYPVSGLLAQVKEKIKTDPYGKISYCKWYWGEYITDVYPDADAQTRYVPFGDIDYENRGPGVLVPLDEANFGWYYRFNNSVGDASLSRQDAVYSNKTAENYYLLKEVQGEGLSAEEEPYLCLDHSIFGNNCYSNSFGNSCYFNSFGNNCYSNSFGNSCDSNSFGNSCDSNSFGNNCDSNSFGNDCYSNSFGNSCDFNSFGNGTIVDAQFDYIQHMYVGNRVQYVQLLFDEQATKPSSSAPLQNLIIKSGVRGTSSAKVTINCRSIALGANYEWIIAKNSKGEIKQYCEADLIN